MNKITIYTPFPKNINSFEKLFKYLKLGKYDLEKYSKLLNPNTEFNSKNLNELFIGGLINYQQMQDLLTFLETK